MRPSRHLVGAAFAASLVFFAAACALSATKPPPGAQKSALYQVTLLPQLPDAREATALAINNSGVIAGRSGRDDGTYVAVMWRNRKLYSLGTLGGEFSEAHGINSSGEIVGAAQVKSGLMHAFLWSQGRMHDLGTLPDGFFSYAEAINGGGTITGFSDAGGATHAFVSTGSSLRDLGPVPGGAGSAALAINSGATIVGTSNLDSDAGGVAFVYSGRYLSIGGFPAKNGSLAHGINDSGLVVGAFGHTVRRSSAFEWQKGVLTVLQTGKSTPYAVANAINNQGVIAGYYLGTSESRAVIWVKGKMIDLDTVIPSDSGWVLLAATAINDNGQIVGHGRYDGRDLPFLLTPE